MSCCCELACRPICEPYCCQPQSSDEVRSTVDSRRWQIKCVSGLISPITCPIWTICNIAMRPIIAATNEPTKPNSTCNRVYRACLCHPPYNRCTLLFCSIFYPYHACDGWVHLPCSRMWYNSTECYAQPFDPVDYASGPERQAMDELDVIQRGIGFSLLVKERSNRMGTITGVSYQSTEVVVGGADQLKQRIEQIYGGIVGNIEAEIEKIERLPQGQQDRALELLMERFKHELSEPLEVFLKQPDES